MTQQTTQPPFESLTPEAVIQAVESIGLQTSGYQLGLNSYENRVYQVGLEDGSTVVTKFYRPSRWSNQAILEEHQFTLELKELDIPVVAPECFDGNSLFTHDNHRFSIYPTQAGRAPNLENDQHLRQLGRYMGRIHALGGSADFTHRPQLNIQTFGDDPYEYLLEKGFIPTALESAYEAITEALLDHIETTFEQIQPAMIRLHGDVHPGNILWSHKHSDSGMPYMIDFDDARMGPAIQDLWMLLPTEDESMKRTLDTLITAYELFHDFDPKEIQLIEPLRTLRMIHHAAWLAKRWHDPAFQLAFPWFNSQNYWEQHILALKEQLSALQEPLIY